MHTLKKVGVFLFGFVFAFMAGVYCEKLADCFYPNKEIFQKELNDIAQYEDAEDDIKTVLQGEEIVTADTKLIIIEHNLITGEEVSRETSIPTKYIGLNRQRFSEEMEVYEISPALTDIKKGFRSLSVISFSKEIIYLQKNYSGNYEPMHFFIVSKDNKLVVYYEDMETVYLTTEIFTDTLPENVRLEILNKKYFESEEELYNFLESYSS